MRRFLFAVVVSAALTGLTGCAQPAPATPTTTAEVTILTPSVVPTRHVEARLLDAANPCGLVEARDLDLMFQDYSADFQLKPMPGVRTGYPPVLDQNYTRSCPFVGQLNGFWDPEKGQDGAITVYITTMVDDGRDTIWRTISQGRPKATIHGADAAFYGAKGNSPSADMFAKRGPIIVGVMSPDDAERALNKDRATQILEAAVSRLVG